MGAKKITPVDLHYAQQYIMASCVIKRYHGQPISSEASGWAGGVLENSSFSIEQYQLLARIGENTEATDINKNGQIVNIQTCFNLAASTKTKNEVFRILR